jgi:hypothetical protein
LYKKQPRRQKLSRVKVEIDDELDFDLDDGDMIIHIKHDGEIGKVCMPDMNADVKNSQGYAKMLQCLEILKPGTKEEFIKYHEKQRKGTVH